MPTRLKKINLSDPVSRHMHANLICLRVNQTVGEALEVIRGSSREGSSILYFYAVDAEGRLKGVVPTRRLLLGSFDSRIADLMVHPAISLPRTATVLEACEFFTFHRFLAFPVVDEEQRPIGQVDVNLYTEELSDLESHDRSEDLFQLIGVHLTQARQTYPPAAFRVRFPWLICNLVGGILAAILAWLYRDTLEKTTELAMFIPVVLALAESVAIQSTSLALQALHGLPPTWPGFLKRLRLEVTTGLLLGGAAGGIMGLVALCWLGKAGVAASLLGAIGIGVAFAAGVGLALPVALRLFRRDPRVAAGPVALTLADLATLLLYFNLGHWLLR